MIDSSYIGPFIYNLALWAIGLFILYKIIVIAVREGINQSNIGKMIQNKQYVYNDSEPTQQNDWDNN
ncbi:hypothetical protein [Virgibacillus halodenitrificans]|uniref:hypothetical protein n=1 Tax=Virgibacillus halodenitrificans TaxID=1482 RepID=UPI000316DC0A|nr:hypothetical protein [Virgibacillus halodenitrificans]MCJ0933294.1 hypothetical protein [Virgibacillus halodenitrificans]CDQ32427.1 hypothetical protein BN993_01842 [Virgibacillus halodenitrificans]